MESPPPGTLARSADVRYCNQKVQEAVRRFLRVDGLRNDGQCHLYTAVGVSLGGASGRHSTMHCPSDLQYLPRVGR